MINSEKHIDFKTNQRSQCISVFRSFDKVKDWITLWNWSSAIFTFVSVCINVVLHRYYAVFKCWL